MARITTRPSYAAPTCAVRIPAGNCAPYDPADWYWIVGGSTTQVYSSKVGDFVPVAYMLYVAWLTSGQIYTPPRQPTRIDTETNLAVVLAGHFRRPIPPAMLDSYKEAQAATYTPVDVTPKILHYMLNEIRDLQSKPPLTFEQFRQAVKDRT